MAVYHLSTTGTKAAASGPSTPDDWSDVNCYADFRLFAAFGYLSDGDEIILNDEHFRITATVNTTLIVNGVANVTLRSRSNNPETCSLKCTTAGTRTFLIQSNNAVPINFFVNGINFGHTSDAGGQSGILVQINGTAMTNVEFSNCLFSLDVPNMTANGDSKIIAFDQTVRTVKFTNATRFAGITLSTVAPNAVGLMSVSSGKTTLQFGDSAVESDATIFDGVTLTQSANSFGLIKIDGCNASGRIDARNIVISAPSGDEFSIPSVRGIVFHSGLGFVDLEGSCDNVVVDGGKCEGVFLRSGGRHRVRNVTMTNCHVLSTGNSHLGNAPSGLGGIVCGIGSAADGEYENLTIVDSSGWFGMLTYQSAGAIATYTGAFIARRCNVQGAVVYSGGSGDTHGIYASLLVEECHGVQDVVAIYSHNVKRTGEQRDKLFDWGAITSRDNTGGHAESGAITARFANGAYEFNFIVSVGNLLADNPGANVEFVRDESLSASTGQLTVTIENSWCGRSGMIVDNGSSYGSITLHNDRFGDPGFVKRGIGGNFALSFESPAKTGASPWWILTERRPSDIAGEPYPDTDISFGARQSIYIDSHPANS